MACSSTSSDIPHRGSELIHTTRRNGAIGFSNAACGSDTKQYNLKPMGVYVPQGSSSEKDAPPQLQQADDGTWTVTGKKVCEGTFGYCIQGDKFAKTILVMWYIKDSTHVDDNSNLWNIHIVPGQVTPGEIIHNDLKKGACGYPAPIAPQDGYIVREFQDKDLQCELRLRDNLPPGTPIAFQDNCIEQEFQDKDKELHCELQGCMTRGPNCTLETGITYLPA